MRSAMDLALFDLDHTLLPIDSDYEWSRFLVRIGVLDAEAYESENDRFYRQYQAGTLDIAEFLRFQLAPLAAHPRDTLDAWHRQFMREVIEPQILPPARELVDRHRARGDLVALVTATNAFVTAPIARAFGIEHLVATGIEEVGGAFTGRPHGTPSFREGKIVRTDEWLASLGRALPDFGRSWFYSDSRNDIPLLDRVTDPVATNPDAVLHETALARGWPVIRLFEGAA
jgi:HAD superfamily hydrolase (TIGR01490 family)